MQVLSSLSSIPFYAPSAGFAPTNSADVSAIASAYQVVSATATQLNAGTAYLTSVNDTPISASRAGNAANASLANSAWYDGTGRLISSLPDEATVSSIASAYAESAASSKQDTLSFSYDDDKISAINGSALAGGGGATGDYVEKDALEVAIGSRNTASSKSIAQGSGNSAISLGCAFGENNRASNRGFAQGYYNIAINNSLAQGYNNSASGNSFACGTRSTATASSFAWGAYVKSVNYSTVFGKYNLRGDGDTSTGDSAAFAIGDGTASGARHDLMLVTKNGEITMYSSTADTVGTGIMSSIRALSANAGGVDSATVSAIASAYAESAVSSKQDTLTFDWDADSAISSINGSALAGGGGAQVVTSITTGGYGVREINGMVINASHMKLGAAAADNTSNVVQLGDIGYGAGVFLTGSFGTAYYKVNELQLNRNGTGFIGFNIGGAGSQITATSNAGGKFSAGGTSGNRSYFTAFNASASASIEVTGSTAMINITDTGYTSTIYPSSIPYWNAKLDSAEMSAYVEKTAYDNLYSAFTALSDVISTYSGWFSELSSISAKVDNSAIGVIE